MVSIAGYCAVRQTVQLGVEKTTSDGRAIKLSKDGNDRCIAGSSSGAVCAFTAAWERPDAFSRVYSTIGTYVGLRGYGYRQCCR